MVVCWYSLLRISSFFLIFSVSFLIFVFDFFLFFCSIFLFKFRIIFIWNLLYFRDEESSELVTCSVWLQSNGLFSSRKNTNTGDRGGWGHRFSRDIRKEHVKRLRMFMKNLWNFHWCWFLTLAFPPGRGFTQFYRICRGGSLFSKSKLTNLNNSGFFQKSSYRGWNKGKTFAGESIY